MAVNQLIKKWTLAINLKGNYGAHSLRKTWGYIQQGSVQKQYSRTLGTRQKLNYYNMLQKSRPVQQFPAFGTISKGLQH